jgi:AcrR family transcriptional regulator
MTSDAAPPARTRNARGAGARLREEIIAAATRLLEAQPAESITLRAIAREAGITAPSIYRHFATVGDVLRAVVEATFDVLEDRLRNASVGDSAVTRLRSVCASYLSFAEENPEQYRLLFGGAWNAADLPVDADAERSERADIGLATFAVLVERIADCVEEGSSTSTDPADDAAGLWVGLHGFASLRRTTPLFRWPATLVDDLVSSLAHVTS